MGDMWDIARKQVKDSFSSRRFLIILGVFLLLSLASVYLGVQDYQMQLERFASGDFYGAAPERPSLIDVFTPLFGFNMPLTAGILGLLLSHDYISREREEGTIELLLSYPVYRDEIINGKLVAGIFTVAVSLLSAFTLSSGLAIFMLDTVPGLETISRLGMVWIGTVIYITFFLGLGTFFSTLMRSRWRSLIGGGLVLLLFIGTPFLANMAASQIYQFNPGEQPGTQPGPLPGPRTASSDMAVEREVAVGGGTGSTGGGKDRSSIEEQRAKVEAQRERFVSIVSRLSPSTSYSNFVGTMTGTEYESEQGLEPTFAESLSSSAGYLIFLISQTLMVLTGAYAVFLRQDL
ncbi:MAG: ABC-2 type transport system permease protein [Candidatus Nanohaloarchaea archaeon]|jgi:ABC-2 type transport system permease protein